MADDTRTEGLRGIGADGFIRTVSNLTITGDLVVHGETRSTIGTGSAFWEVADANAAYWAFELPSGGSVNVPVLGVGIGIDGVDLGLFDGVTQTTLAVMDADRDSFIALDYSADDAARLRSNTAITISPTGSLSVGTDGSGNDVVFYSDTSGDNLTWDSGDEVLQITGTNGQTSLDVLDGDVKIVDTLYFFDRGGESMSSDGSTLTVAGTVVFSGNITVNGTTTTVSSSTVVIDDPLFHLGNDNNADAVDLGIFAEYTDSGKKFSGLFRDASDSDKWKLFATSGNSHEEPSTTVNTTSGFTLATLVVNELEGTLTTAAQTNITSTGALDGGSITSNFGTIDSGASTITTTGLISGGSLDIDNVLINGTTIGHTDDTDLLTVADQSLTLAGQLILDGDHSVTPGDGAAIHLDTHTVTDSNTSGSGTATKYTHVNIEAPTLAATNSSVTTTDAATLYVSGAVAAGTNETLTRTWAVWVDAGNVRYDGSVYAGTTEALNSSGLVTVANQSNITGVGTISSGTWEGTTLAVDQGGTGATSLNNLITLTTHTSGNYVATLTGGTGIDSDAATSGEGTTHTLSIDLNEVGEVAIADGDYIAFMDATDSSATKKEALADVATLFAGTGLTAASSVIGVDAAQSGITSVGTLTGLTLDGDKSVTPGDGSMIHLDTSTITDSNTSGSGTAALYTHVRLEAPTLAATNSSVTTSDAATLYINGPITAGTNQTLTRNWGLWLDTGNARFDGSIYSGTTEAINSSGVLQVAGQTNITSVGALDGGSVTSNFGSIDNGSSAITTTGAISGGTIDATTDFTIGTTVITDDSIVMTPTTSDTVTIAAATNGALNITTVDAAAAAANVTWAIDGYHKIAGGSKVFLNETADAGVTIGMSINQGTADDSIISLKSSDVAHPFTAVAEADTFGLIRKGSGATGGLRTRAFTEGDNFAHTTLGYIGGTPVTTNSTSGWPMIAEDAYHTNGSTGSQAAPSNSNLWGVVSAGAAVKAIIDAEGDLHLDGSTSAYDDEDDISLLRAVQKAIAPSQVITQGFDRWLTSNEDDLIRLGILGASRTPDKDGHHGLVNISKLLQLVTGGVVQLYGQLLERDKRIETLERKMLALGG